ncbi:MAG: bifunctional riboflavin kinase/FAD synthetase [Buchnera aphidicola (Schlechtendalia peitan)]
MYFVKKKEHNKPIIVTIFEPQPQEYFNPHNPPARLMKLREKITYLSKWNIDTILCIYFNKKFSILSPTEFVINIMVKKLKVCFLAIGENFHFGANRKGNIIFLKKMGAKYNFEVYITDILKIKGIQISSTAVRMALKNSNFKLAKKLLGRSFSISGRVVHGKKNGNIIGFPTANIILFKHLAPIHGVFIVQVFVFELQKTFSGVANIGIQPTVYGTKQNLEVHLINIAINLYKKYIQIIFIQKIRDEIFFPSIEELKKQIGCDIETANLYFRNNSIKI